MDDVNTFEFLSPRVEMNKPAGGKGMIEIAVEILPDGNKYRGSVRVGRNKFDYVSRLHLPVEYLVNAGSAQNDIHRMPMVVSAGGRNVRLDERMRYFFSNAIASSIFSYAHGERNGDGRRTHQLGEEVIKDSLGTVYFMYMPPHLVPAEFMARQRRYFRQNLQGKNRGLINPDEISI
jgi:hypothetical protein